MGKKLQFTELDQYLFGQGTNYDIYRKLGAHPDTQNRKKGVYFAVWAPNAQAVSVVIKRAKQLGMTYAAQEEKLFQTSAPKNSAAAKTPEPS